MEGSGGAHIPPGRCHEVSHRVLIGSGIHIIDPIGEYSMSPPVHVVALGVLNMTVMSRVGKGCESNMNRKSRKGNVLLPKAFSRPPESNQ